MACLAGKLSGVGVESGGPPIKRFPYQQIKQEMDVGRSSERDLDLGDDSAMVSRLPSVLLNIVVQTRH